MMPQEALGISAPQVLLNWVAQEIISQGDIASVENE